MTAPIPRRQFISTAGLSIAVAGARLMAQPVPPKPEPKPKAVGVRQNVAGMAGDHPVLKSYRKAIEAMTGRKADDPLSWQFQANMHGFVPGGKANPDWAWCVHGNWWFLPWHRGYLYYFERIVRKLSGDDAFRLPYWPWEQPRRNVLPAPFRTEKVGGERNWLYDGTRTAVANGGRELRPGTASGSFAIDWERARRTSRFVSGTAALAFGGVRVAKTRLPVKPSSGQHGVMESQAHDYVHVAVGGRGNMGDPDTAALDPIFWLHHANVDRLWNRWQDDAGHRLPDPTADKDWYEQKFPFYDETGTRVEVSVTDILELAKGAYLYDEEERRRPVFGAAVPKEVAVKETVVGVASAPPKLKLGPTEFAQPLTLAAEAGPKLEAAFTAEAVADVEPPAAILLVEGITPPKDGEVAFEVFVTKKGDKPSEDTYLGPITFFGRGGHGHGAGEGFDQGFDATDVLQRLRRANKGELPELEVIIRPVSTAGLTADELAKTKVEVPLTGISLKLVTEEKK